MEIVKMNDDELDQISGGSVIPYLVQPGDTLYALSQKFNVSVEQLMRWNNIKDPNTLMVGDKMNIKY